MKNKATYYKQHLKLSISCDGQRRRRRHKYTVHYLDLEQWYTNGRICRLFH